MISSILFLICSILIWIFALGSKLSIPVFLVFMILKLCNTICWSWFWVIFPLICGFGCVLFIGVLKIFIQRFE